MDNKKIVSVAVLAVLALAFAGYGYADYTASTYNEGNEVVINYIKVTPSTWNAIADAQETIELNTYTIDDKVVYSFADDNKTVPDDGYVQIGEDYTLTIAAETTVDFSSYSINVAVHGQVGSGANFNLYLKCGENYEQLTASGATFEVEGETAVFGLYMLVEDYEDQGKFPTESGWKDLVGTVLAPPTVPLLTGLVDDTNAPEDTPAGAILIFEVSGVE